MMRLERAFVVHRRRREDAAPLADKFGLQRSLRQLNVPASYELEETPTMWIGSLVLDMQAQGQPQRPAHGGNHGPRESKLPAQYLRCGVDHLVRRQPSQITEGVADLRHRFDATRQIVIEEFALQLQDRDQDFGGRRPVVGGIRRQRNSLLEALPQIVELMSKSGRCQLGWQHLEVVGGGRDGCFRPRDHTRIFGDRSRGYSRDHHHSLSS